MEIQSEQDCVTGIKNLVCSKSTDALMSEMLCTKCWNAHICSKVEIFIHVLIQNFMWLSYTEVRVTAGQHTIS